MPWSCDVCTYINEKETFLACEMCQTPRGSSKKENVEEAESIRNGNGKDENGCD